LQVDQGDIWTVGVGCICRDVRAIIYHAPLADTGLAREPSTGRFPCFMMRRNRTGPAATRSVS
jgi:hypothetical protein